jgi:hypothetical protein
MAGSRGRRRAAQPSVGWKPPQRLLAGGMAVRFIAERDGQEKVFDFAGLPVLPELAGWLARAFERRTSPRRAVKTVATAETLFGGLRVFAEAMGGHRPEVTDVTALSVAHLQAFWRYCQAREELDPGSRMQLVRSVLRHDPELPERVRTALVLDWAPPKAARPAEPKEREYTDQEWQLIMTVLRRDVRVARDRIRAGRVMLARYRAGEIAPGTAQEIEGQLLDVFDRTGDFPRYGGRRHVVKSVNQFGGSTVLASRLCLTMHEVTAFALLLTALTGENFGTVAKWPAAHYRPDGGLADAPQIALLEENKPRRGPDREHMVVPLEDLPSSLAGVLSLSGEDRLLRSPLKVYQLLLELSDLSRRHGGSSGAFSGRGLPGRYGGGGWFSGVGAHNVYRWAGDRGFGRDGRVSVHVGRIRQTVTERRRRPVAHTQDTMNDQYLMPSKQVRRESQGVVAAALLEEVGKARARQHIPVFTAAFIARFHADPQTAAAEAGLDAEAVKHMVEGKQDTALVSCVDHLTGPHDEVGKPCPASFLSCLDCVNARALSHQLPVQIAAAEHIAAWRPHLDPDVWEVRWRPRLAQLSQIVDTYTSAERQRARALISAEDRKTIADLFGGRWDLR